MPGAALGVLRQGEPATAYFGFADVRTEAPVTASTRFGIGSLTKTMVASAVAVLDAQHHLCLDDPVASHVPELRGNGWADSSTVRDLLANRSPVPRRTTLEFGFDEHDGEDDRALARLVEEVAAQASCPGHWSYANVGWCLLGRAIESVTGGSWERAMPELLSGAGLCETQWSATATDRAVGHDVSRHGRIPVEPLLSRAYSPAGATVASTLGDMLRYAAWHLADAVPATLRTIHAEVSIPGWLQGWGLGLGRFDWNGTEVWGWDGVVNGQRSVVRLLPDRDGALVVLANGSTGRAMASDLLTAAAPAWLGVDVPTSRLDPSDDVPLELSSYAGCYGWPDRCVEVAATEDRLLVTEDGTTKQAMPLDRTTFLVDRDDPDTPTIAFAEFDAAGRPGVLYDMVWGLERLPE